MAHLGALLLMLASIFCQAFPYSVEFPQPPELKFEYHNNVTLKEYLTEISEAYPNLTNLYTIGKSVKGVELQVLEISATSRKQLGIPNVKLVANIHGNEPGGREMVLHMIQFLVSNYATNSTVQWLLNNTRIHMLPSINPDGFKVARAMNCVKDDEDGRENFRHINLNRNYPDYFRKNSIPQQPETKAIINWLHNVPFILSASLHSGALVVNYPFDNTHQDTWEIASKRLDSSVEFEDMADLWKQVANVTGVPPSASISPDDDVFKHLSRVYAQAHPTMHKGLPCPGSNQKGFEGGITNGAAWYTVSGGMQDYNYAFHGCFEVTIEISCCKYPKPQDLPQLWKENKEALLKFVAQAHRGIRGLVMDYETNKTIAGAKLWVDDRYLEFNTSKNGEFWRILLPGNYTLKVTAKNYRNKSIPFEVISYDDDFKSEMTWLNVSLLALNSTVSLIPPSSLTRDTTVPPPEPSTENSSSTSSTSSTTLPPSTSPPLPKHKVKKEHLSSTAVTGTAQNMLCMVVAWVMLLLSG